jgi:hypothetical protein
MLLVRNAKAAHLFFLDGTITNLQQHMLIYASDTFWPTVLVEAPL